MKCDSISELMLVDVSDNMKLCSLYDIADFELDCEMDRMDGFEFPIADIIINANYTYPLVKLNDDNRYISAFKSDENVMLSHINRCKELCQSDSWKHILSMNISKRNMLSMKYINVLDEIKTDIEIYKYDVMDKLMKLRNFNSNYFANNREDWCGFLTSNNHAETISYLDFVSVMDYNRAYSLFETQYNDVIETGLNMENPVGVEAWLIAYMYVVLRKEITIDDLKWIASKFDAKFENTDTKTQIISAIIDSKDYNNPKCRVKVIASWYKHNLDRVNKIFDISYNVFANGCDYEFMDDILFNLECLYGVDDIKYPQELDKIGRFEYLSREYVKSNPIIPERVITSVFNSIIENNP